MRLNRLVAIPIVALMGLALWGCSGNASSNGSEADVFFSTDVTQGPADVDISIPNDVVVPSMTFNSHAKSPGTVLSQQQDAYFTEWVMTATRADGGTKASPQWRWFYNVYVPAGGTANLQNYRIFPSDYFKELPLSYLFPQNGGFDKETGKRNIRQHIHIDVYGKTVAGRPVVNRIDFDLNFFYVSP